MVYPLKAFNVYFFFWTKFSSQTLSSFKIFPILRKTRSQIIIFAHYLFRCKHFHKTSSLYKQTYTKHFIYKFFINIFINETSHITSYTTLKIHKFFFSSENLSFVASKQFSINKSFFLLFFSTKIISIHKKTMTA